MSESDKSLGKKILGFFIKEAEVPAKSTTAPPSALSVEKESASNQLPPLPMSNGVENSAGTATVDRKFVEHFVDLLEKSNQPGHDYFEFKQALKSMEGLGLDEQKQYLASWASFKAMGGFSDTQSLVESANQYIQVLDKDRVHFLKDVDKAISERVGSLQKDLNNLQENNTAYARQIKELQEKINANNQKISSITNDIQEQSHKLTESRDSYDITYQSFVEQLKADIARIQSYLK